MRNLHSAIQKSIIAFASSRGTSPPGAARVGSFSRTFSAKASPETQYILRYDYVSDVLEKRGPHREEHLRLARENAITGGPTTPLDATVPTGAFFTFNSAERAQLFAVMDPYVTSGIVTAYTIEEWTVAVKN